MTLDRWWTFSEDIVNLDRDKPGVYEFCNLGSTVIYIGSANEVRRRLREHLAEPASSCIRRKTEKYCVEYTATYKERERELYDEFVRTHGKAPECNDVRP
jgi:excinuclease UvrABC nuclease subunit